MIRSYCGFLFVRFALVLRLITWPHVCDGAFESPASSFSLETLSPTFKTADLDQERSESFEDWPYQSPLDDQAHGYSRSVKTTSNQQTIYSGQYLPTRKLVDADFNLGKRPRMDAVGGSQLDQPNIYQDFNLRENRENLTPKSQRILSDLPTDKYDPLARSEFTLACLTLAEQVFQKKNHSKKKANFQKLYSKQNKRISQKSTATFFRYGIKKKLEHLPIVVNKERNSEHVIVRLVHLSGERKGRPSRLRSSRTRVQWLFVAIDFFHDIAFHAGLDKSILGINDNLHEDLLTWFENVLFHQTADSLPIMGYGEISGDLPKNLENLFGIPQKHLSLFLTMQDGNNSNFFYTALSLLGYWYKNVAPNAKLNLMSSFDRNFDKRFWRLMEQELDKLNHLPYEAGRKMAFWKGKSSE